MEPRTSRRTTLLSRPAAGTLVAILAALVLAADQFSKHLALTNLPYQEPVEVWGQFLQFYLTRNPGAAFSFGEEVTWVFTLMLAAAAVTIVVLAVTRPAGPSAGSAVTVTPRSTAHTSTRPPP